MSRLFLLLPTALVAGFNVPLNNVAKAALAPALAAVIANSPLQPTLLTAHAVAPPPVESQLPSSLLAKLVLPEKKVDATAATPKAEEPKPAEEAAKPAKKVKAAKKVRPAKKAAKEAAPTVEAAAPAPTPPPAPAPAPTPPAKAPPSKKDVTAGVAAVLLAGGGFAYTQKNDSPSPPAPKPAGKPVKPTKKWPMRGGSGASHPMAGPWPSPPTRKVWKPPKGWKPPTKPVTSWYDRGDRLKAPPPPAPEPEAAAPAAPQKRKNWWDSFWAATPATSTAASSPAAKNKKWPMRGGSGASHPMAGPWPSPPTRKVWKPPKGWKPPSKPPAPVDTVPSWYDAGRRL